MVVDNNKKMLGVLVILSDVTARKTSEIKLRIRMQREAVTNRISTAIRNAASPDAVQMTAVTALGEEMVADRAFFISLDQFENRASITRDYYRAGLNSVAGTYSLAKFPDDLTSLFHGKRALKVDDVATSELSAISIANLRGTCLRALLAVPMYDGDTLDSLLCVAMDSETREWADDEAELAESVATQTLTAAEASRLRLREHRIATILQDALRPSLPERVPGMAIASYYLAALDEASIGGDFLDVFTVDSNPNRNAILIGDVSGKGLAAATQVATVRMMLRYALTRGDVMASAVTHLNDTLSTRDWLIGFATLFVAIYDADRNELRYVSCGHEPGLIRRAATGEIEELAATGAAMGAFEGAVYHERTVKMDEGDALVLYTDGVSEAGPNRRQTLNSTGVAEIVAAAPQTLDAQQIVNYLRRELNRFSGGLLRDDVCMMAGIASKQAAEPTARRRVSATRREEVGRH